VHQEQRVSAGGLHEPSHALQVPDAAPTKCRQ
jgi:hypothetical protein